MRVHSLFVAVALVACVTTHAAPPAPPGPPSCATACARLRQLRCTATSPSGTPCEPVCENVQASGAITWNLACRSQAASCVEIDACER